MAITNHNMDMSTNKNTKMDEGLFCMANDNIKSRTNNLS